jgi:hypothetical protein
MMEREPHRFSRAVENLVASFRHLPQDRGRSRRRAITPLTDVVDQLLTKYQIGRPSAEQTIRDNWPALVGPANAAYSNAVRLDRGRRLLVHASHSVVRSELFLHRAAIVERIQKLPGCAEIKEIFVRAG